jgi:hypothetical protein
MLGGNMNGKRLRMQKLLLARWATERQMPLMLFHMIMHRVLILFDLGTDGADKLASSILLIRVRHFAHGPAVARFNFLLDIYVNES